MDNANEYVIILKNETDDENSSPIAGSSSQAKAPKGNETAKTLVKGLVAYNKYVKPFASQIISHSINTVTLATGAEEYQRLLQFQYEMASTVIGIGESILVGTAIGNIPGAIIGAVIGVATTALTYSNRSKTIQMENNLEQITLRSLNTRAGGFVPSYSGSRGGRQ